MNDENAMLVHPDAINSQPGVAGLFKFCPRCGREGPGLEAHRAIRCPHCGFLFFFNCAAAVGAFVFHQQRLILGVRAHEPAKGMLDVPGGFVEYDETLEAALRREIFEELNIEVSGLRYLASEPNDYTYAGVPYKTMDTFFVCEATDIGTIRAADDVETFVVINPEELDPSRLGFRSARRAFAALRDDPDYWRVR